jgi:uncharacterized peroxidase-related enzyme
METHGEDLRAEIQAQPGADERLAALKADYRRADLSPRDRAMLDYAVKLTRDPSGMGEEDVAALRRAGLDDAAIHDVAQITALFNYYNRIADGLGIDPEP